MNLKVLVKGLSEAELELVQKSLESLGQIHYSVQVLQDQDSVEFPLFDFIWLIFPDDKKNEYLSLIKKITTMNDEKLKLIPHDGNSDWWKIQLEERICDLKLFKLSRLDEVTGLGNQRLLKDDLRKFIYESTPLTLLFLDIDEFKKVNDGHGHLMGSKILKDVSVILKTFFQGKTSHLYRYGGDEFVAMLPSTPLEQAFEYAKQFSEKVQSCPFDIGKLTVSIGISQYPEDAQSVDEIINIADLMMYSSKKSGKGLITHKKK